MIKGTQVKVKWDRKWYPATVLLQINDDEVRVKFDNPDFPLETVPISDIKVAPVPETEAIIKVISNSSPVKSIAGEFNWQIFKIFFKEVMGDSNFVTPLTVQELAVVDLKSTLFSVHATERIEERFNENMQELRRSLTADQFLAFRETRCRVFCGNNRIDSTPDLKRIISVSPEKYERVNDPSNFDVVSINRFKNAVHGWNLTHYNPPTQTLSQRDYESCYFSGEVHSTQVITTTTRFVLSEDCSCIVTVIPHRLKFGEWRKEYDKAHKQKPKNCWGPW